jgi:hypothetical protein
MNVHQGYPSTTHVRHELYSPAGQSHFNTLHRVNPISGTVTPDGQGIQMNVHQGYPSTTHVGHALYSPAGQSLLNTLQRFNPISGTVTPECAPSPTNIPSLMGMPFTPMEDDIKNDPVNQPSQVSFKNLLQEYMQQRGIITFPKYETTLTGWYAS